MTRIEWMIKCKLMSCFIDIYPWLIIKLHWPRKIAWCPDVSDVVAVMCKREDENKKNWFSEIEIQYWIDMMPCIHLLIFTIVSVEKGVERLGPRLHVHDWRDRRRGRSAFQNVVGLFGSVYGLRGREGESSRSFTMAEIIIVARFQDSAELDWLCKTIIYSGIY